jgi:prepilin-type N-terminal cleavage/methylation domain-containing protein
MGANQKESYRSLTSIEPLCCTNIVKHKFSTPKGFTLIELLIVVTIIATLAVTVFVALNPAQRLKDAKDARRTSDVDTILTAIHASVVDAKGILPTNLNSVANGQDVQLGAGNSTDCAAALTSGGCSTQASTACTNLLTGAQNLTAYLKTMPIDPGNGTTFDANKTGYAVQKDANGIVTVKACAKEGTANIWSSR